MSGVVTAVAVTTAAGSYLGSRAQTKAANNAAAATREAAAGSNAEIARQYDLTRQDFAPYLGAGTNALYAYQDLLGLEPTLADWQVQANKDREKAIADATAKSAPAAAPTSALVPTAGGFPIRRVAGGTLLSKSPAAPGTSALLAGYLKGPTAGAGDTMSSDLRAAMDMPYYQLPTRTRKTPEEILASDPSYKFRFDQGLKAVNASALAGGGYKSGNQLRALTDYGQGAASQEYSAIASRLAGLAGVGQQTAGQQGTLGANAANAMAGNTMAAGRSASDSALYSGAAKAGFYNDMGQLPGQAFSTYAGYKYGQKQGYW